MSIQYHDQPNTVTVAADRSTVENTDQPATVDVSTTETTVTVVSGIGAIGPQGPEGPQGPAGGAAKATRHIKKVQIFRTLPFVRRLSRR